MAPPSRRGSAGRTAGCCGSACPGSRGGGSSWARGCRCRRPGTPCRPGPASPAGPTGAGPVARGARRRSGHGWSRAPPDPCARGTRRKSITTCTSPPNAFPLPEYHRWRPVSGLRRGDPVGADQGPVQAGVRLFGRAQPLKDLGKVRGPVGDHPQGPVAGTTCRPWPGSPSSRGPGWSGRCPPPSTSAGARPGARQVAALGHGRTSCALRWAANHRQMARAMDSATSEAAG